ncbi:MAG: DUF1801 domain-containing protein [Bacteroidota bacterium]
MESEFKNVDEYISLQSPEIRNTLELLRKTIKDAAPEALEMISYQMPAYKYHGMLAFFAAFKKHYSIFLNPDVVEFFKEELKPYKSAKATIQFPLNTPVPVELVSKLVQYAANVKLLKAQMKKDKKNK